MADATTAAASTVHESSKALHHATLSDQQKHLLARLDLLPPTITEIHNTLDKKLQYNFTIMSAFVSVLIIGNISWFDRPNLGSINICSLLVFAVCYAVVALSPLYAHWPRERLVSPVSPSWDSLLQWWNYEPDEYTDQVLLSYESLYNDDKNVRDCKARLVIASHIAVVLGIGAAIFQSAYSLGLFPVS